MELTRETKVDVLVILVMLVYGAAVVATTPPMAIAAWAIAGLVALKHLIEPVGTFAEDHHIIFMLIALAILSIGFLLSR